MTKEHTKEDEDAWVSERVQLLHDFTHQEFLGLMENADRPCEACGETNWFTPEQEGGRPTMVSMPIYATEGSIQLYVPRVCGACANTRFYNTGWLIDGIKKRRSERG